MLRNAEEKRRKEKKEQFSKINKFYEDKIINNGGFC